MQEILIKYSIPSKFCLEPYGTIWKQMLDGETCVLFVQTSNKPEEANWIEMGQFLGMVFAHKIEDDNFIQECLKQFNKD